MSFATWSRIVKEKSVLNHIYVKDPTIIEKLQVSSYTLEGGFNRTYSPALGQPKFYLLQQLRQPDEFMLWLLEHKLLKTFILQQFILRQFILRDSRAVAIVPEFKSVNLYSGTRAIYTLVPYSNSYSRSISSFRSLNMSIYTQTHNLYSGTAAIRAEVPENRYD